MKSTTTGLGYNASQSYKPARLAVLLFLNVVASLVLIVLGMAVRQAMQHFQYQANTVKNRQVLSYHFIGLRAVADRRLKISSPQIKRAIQKINQLIRDVHGAI